MESLNNSNEGRCFLTCLECQNKPLYYINYSKLHGVCENHVRVPLLTERQCRRCNSIVKYYIIEQISCDLCSKTVDCNVLDCDHHICNLCIGEIKRCLICNPCCSKCREMSMLTKYECKHFLCKKCAEYTINTCTICNPPPCLACKLNPRKEGSTYCEDCYGPCNFCRNESIIDTSLGCKHNQCKECSKKGYFCMVCKITICNHCAEYSKKQKKKCKKHHLCLQCINEYWLTNCMICKGEANFVCDNCVGIGIVIQCDRKVHKICLQCSNNIACPMCISQCCICATEFSQKLLKQYTCGHLICQGCENSQIKNKKPCQFCPATFETVQCYNCMFPHNRTKSTPLKIKCQCGETICLFCGKHVGFFTGHECKINNN